MSATYIEERVKQMFGSLSTAPLQKIEQAIRTTLEQSGIGILKTYEVRFQVQSLSDIQPFTEKVQDWYGETFPCSKSAHEGLGGLTVKNVMEKS